MKRVHNNTCTPVYMLTYEPLDLTGACPHLHLPSHLLEWSARQVAPLGLVRVDSCDTKRPTIKMDRPQYFSSASGRLTYEMASQVGGTRWDHNINKWAAYVIILSRFEKLAAHEQNKINRRLCFFFSPSVDMRPCHARQNDLI